MKIRNVYLLCDYSMKSMPKTSTTRSAPLIGKMFVQTLYHTTNAMELQYIDFKFNYTILCQAKTSFLLEIQHLFFKFTTVVLKLDQ